MGLAPGSKSSDPDKDQSQIGRQIQAGNRPEARTDTPMDEAHTQGPSFTGPVTRARARMTAETGQTRDNPPPS